MGTGEELAQQHPEWKTEEPFASLLKGDMKGALAGGMKSLAEIIIATHAGITTGEFEQIVQDWNVIYPFGKSRQAASTG